MTFAEWCKLGKKCGYIDGILEKTHPDEYYKQDYVTYDEATAERLILSAERAELAKLTLDTLDKIASALEDSIKCRGAAR